MVHGPSQKNARHAGQQAHQGEFQGVSACNLPLGQAQHPQHGAVVQVTLGEVTRADGHGHGRQQGRQQGHQAQELVGAVKGLAHLGTPALEGFQPQTPQRLGADVFLHLLRERLDRGVRSRHGQAPGDAAGRLHQAGGRQIGHVQHDPRRKAQKASAPIRLHHDQALDLEGGIAQQQVIAHGQAQGFEHGLIHPHHAARRPAWRNLHQGLGSGLDLQLPAQGIVRAHGLDGHQPRCAAAAVARPPHAGKAGAGGGLQAQGLCTLGQPGGGRLVAGHHSVTAQQLAGITRQTGVETIREEGHGREGGHGQQHSQGQQTQLAGLKVTPGLAGGHMPQAGRPNRARVGWGGRTVQGGHVQKVPQRRGPRPQRGQLEGTEKRIRGFSPRFFRLCPGLKSLTLTPSPGQKVNGSEPDPNQERPDDRSRSSLKGKHRGPVHQHQRRSSQRPALPQP